MASFQQTPKGWRVQIAIKGTRDSGTFPTKRDAQQWAMTRELEIRAQAAGNTVSTLYDALDKFAEEVSSKRKGWRWESLRIEAFKRSVLPIKLRIGQVTPEHIALWRDVRTKEVAPGTVLREVGILSEVFEAARRDWRWIDTNPVKLIRKPSKPPHRERIINRKEIKTMLRTLNHRVGISPRSVTQSVAMAFLVALRTGMRAGELTGLRWEKVFDRHVRLDQTKTGVARDVPLSSKAKRLINQARGFDRDSVFGVSSQSLDVLFRRARTQAGLDGFTFHDARHTAATWLGRSGKVQLLEMCRVFGWRDPKHALIYFNPTVVDLADKLDHL